MLNLANRLTAMQGQRLSRADAAIQNSTVPKGYTGCENECKIWWIQIQLNLAQNVRSNWISIWKPHSPTATARISRSGFTLLPHHLFFVQISLFFPEDFCSRYVGFGLGRCQHKFFLSHNSRLVRAASHLPHRAGRCRQIWTVVRAKAVPWRPFQVAVLKQEVNL